MDIGLKIKEIADAKKISAKDLAKEIGRTRQAVYDIYSGKVSVNVDLLEKICQALNIEVYELFIDNNSLPKSKQELKAVIQSVLTHIISKNYIPVSLVKELAIDILKNVYSGNGLVNLEVGTSPEKTGYHLIVKYAELKEKPTERELNEYSKAAFGKVFSDIKIQLDGSGYEKIIDDYIDLKFNKQ